MRKIFLACAVAAAMTAGGADAASYKIVKTVPLGAPDHWDYLTFDGPSNRVYVSHGDRVTVVDAASGAIVGNITGMPGGTHGIAISHATHQGFTDDGKAGEVAVFDPATLQVTKRIKAEPDADGIVLDAPTGHIFVMDGDSGKITVIDPKTDSVIATIDGGGALEAGVSGGNGKLYVDGAEKGEIVRVDTATNAVDAHWPVPGCTTPRGIAFDAANHRIFASCASKVMAVMDADSGKLLATLPIDQGSDGAGFDPGLGRAFSSNFAGTLSAIAEKSPANFAALPPIPTQFGARTMTLDPKTHRIFTVAADITVDKTAAPTDYRHRFHTTPGTARLLFLDPVN
ncbi:MAG: YncE family protein [Proteobacteria bacterium]|nr:YncE family protein [Pseudomonadota bacterium]